MGRDPKDLSLVSTNPGDYSCHHDIDVRFRDLDAMGHVNNAVFVTYLELGRVAYMRCLVGGDAGQFDHKDWKRIFPFVVAELSCRYLAPVSLDDPVTVHLRVSRLGRASFDFEYFVTTDQGRPAAVGWSVQVAYDYETGQPMELPEWMRGAVERLEGSEKVE